MLALHSFRQVRLAAALVVIGGLAALTSPVRAQTQIGLAAEAKNDVSGRLSGATRTIVIGDSVRANETISTGNESATLIRFKDDTTLTLGAQSNVVLDKFVFNPDNSAKAVSINLTRGAMRFVTGKSDPRAFALRSQSLVLAIRGTDLLIVADDRTVTVAVTSGTVEVTIPSGQRYTLTPGQNNRLTYGPMGVTIDNINPSAISSTATRIANGDPVTQITIVNTGDQGGTGGAGAGGTGVGGASGSSGGGGGGGGGSVIRVSPN